MAEATAATRTMHPGNADGAGISLTSVRPDLTFWRTCFMNLRERSPGAGGTYFVPSIKQPSPNLFPRSLTSHLGYSIHRARWAQCVYFRLGRINNRSPQPSWV